MPLTSDLFKGNAQLQSCADNDVSHIVANEPPLRRGVNDQGAHVALIHTALRRVMANPQFGLEEATETYGPKTAEVVRQFKAAQTPPILNKALRQTVPDNIVGKLTIAALDRAVAQKKAPLPPVPLPKSNPTDERIIAKRTFEQKFITRPPQDLDPASGGAGFAIGTALNQGVKDVRRTLRNPIEAGDFDDGVVQSKQTAQVASALVLSTVQISKTVQRQPSIVKFGAFAIQFDVTRDYRYTYAAGLPEQLLTVSTTTTFIDLNRGVPAQVLRESHTAPQPTNRLDPR